MANVELSRAPRLDQKVVELIPSLSRAFASKLIAEGRVNVNSAPETKSGYKVRPTDVIEIAYDIEADAKVPAIDLEVLYEDDDCVVIHKPIGVLVHSKGSFNPEATVASWLRSRVQGIEGNRAGIVHRLDRATSGVMICAKNPEALSWLQKQFSQRRTKKTYYALIKGSLTPSNAVIDMPIERNPKAPATFRVGTLGKSARTTYRTVWTQNGYSLIELQPETGRTHQLRVHLAHLGHPIVGDTLYKGEPAERLYLHAAALEITIPHSHERKVFTAPLPESFSDKGKS